MSISGVHSSANNIFAGEHSSLSRIRSTEGGPSEADLRALSQKDTKGVTSIAKDELSYEYNLEEWDQMDEWNKEDAEKFRLFQ